ncbi:MAG: glutathione peroxidase [Spirochaetaceae bacterium]|jgi:glutathione peroxidase|nr:glutathione peroxidase [Spirochaetaceae bacterium]
MESFYRLKAKRINGEKISMDEYKGKTILVVNVASKCGFTPQYEGLEKLYKENIDKGLVILGFPCDQFGHQEPGNEEEIESFCKLNFGVTFPLFKKIDVNGDETHEVYKYLKDSLPGLLGKDIKWNFTKFLIGPDGKPLKRFASTVKPEKLQSHIKTLLKGN